MDAHTQAMGFCCGELNTSENRDDRARESTRRTNRQGDASVRNGFARRSTARVHLKVAGGATIIIDVILARVVARADGALSATI